MDIVAMSAVVIAVTEFLKKVFGKLSITIKGTAAVVLAVLVSIGVVFVETVKTDTPLTFALLPILIQVIVASTITYSIATNKIGRKE